MKTFCEKVFDEFEIGDFENTTADLDEKIHNDPDDSEAYYMRAGMKFAISNYKGAIEDLDKSIDINPKSGFAYYLRGDAKYWSGDMEGAIKDWNRAMYIDPYFKIRFRNFIRGMKERGKA